MHFDIPSGNLGVRHQTKFSNYGSSLSVVDFDNDGWDDLVLGSGSGDSLQFYHNVLGQFQAIGSPFEETENAKQILWVDYDNDGDRDFFILNHMGSSKLYRNNGGMSFTDVSNAVGLPLDAMPNWSAAWGDYDRDGWLDLYWTNNTYTTGMTFTNMLFRNNQNGTFSNVTMYAAVQDSNKSPLATAFLDYDNDQWPDIFIGQDKMHGNVLLRNLGNGKFEDVSAAANANQPICSMNAGVADYDNNGFLDIYVTNSPPGNVLLRNNGNSTFTNVAGYAGVGYFDESWGGNFCDFDNDGDLELYVSGGAFGSAAGFYNNTGNGGFLRLFNIGMAADTSSSYANAIGDFNNDGRCDIVSNNKMPDSTAVWINNSTVGHYIKILPVGTTSNADAVGARIEVYALNKRKIREVHCGIAFMAQNSQVEHVGLGATTNIDSIVVRWPSGHVDKLTNVAVDQKIVITEGSTGAVQPQIFHYGNLDLCSGGSVELYVGRFNSYQWSTGATSSKINVSTAGTYTVTTTDVWGNMRTASINVSAAPYFTPTMQVTQPLCAGNSGMVEIQSITPVASYSVIWPNGAQGMQSGMLSEGPGSVMIEDSYGCQQSLSYSLIAPAAMTMSGQVTDLDCSVLVDGEIDLTVQGGTAPYSFIWSTGGMMEDPTGLPAGAYSVSITDANGCVSDTEFVVLSPAPIMLQYQMGPFGSGEVYLQVLGGTPPFTYQWNDPMMQTSDTVHLQYGTYTAIVTDANGCYDSISVSVPLVLGNEAAAGNEVSIWPQPSKGILNVSWSNDQLVEWELFDLTGRIVKQGNANGSEMRLDLSSLSSACYWLRLQADGMQSTMRVIKD